MGRLWKGVCVGMSIPVVVVVVVLARQLGGEDHVGRAGAPLEVAKRAVPVPPPKERAVRVNASNPFGRVVVPSKSKAPANKTVVAAWDLREMKTKKKEKNESDSSVVKPKKVFGGEGYLPGETVVPTGGTKVSEYKHLIKLGHSKCVAVVGFYNSEDAIKSKELAAVWNEFREAESGKFDFGLCDVRKPGGLETAIRTGVYPNGSAPAVGLPAVLAFPSRDALNESVVVLRGTSGKHAAPKTAIALAKTVFNMVDNLSLGLSSKEGCYTKLKRPVADPVRLVRSTLDPPPSASKPETRLDPDATASAMTSVAS